MINIFFWHHWLDVSLFYVEKNLMSEKATVVIEDKQIAFFMMLQYGI